MLPTEIKRFYPPARQYALARGLDAPSGVERFPHSKPRFVPEGLSFSVSHSGEYWVCGIGAAPLGLDLQRHQPCRTQAIAKRFFHPSETAWLNGQGPDAFFQIWTAKESYVKYTGEGITGAICAVFHGRPSGPNRFLRRGPAAAPPLPGWLYPLSVHKWEGFGDSP